MTMNGVMTISPFFSPNIGGVETHLDDLGKVIEKEGLYHAVITYQPLTSKVKARIYTKTINGFVLRVPWIRNLFYRFEKNPILQFPYLFTGIFIAGFVFLIFNCRKVRVVHGHGLAAGAAAMLLSKIFRKKGVLSIHTIYKFSERPALGKVVKRIFSNIDKILVLAKGAKDDMVHIGISPEKIVIYTCWVDNACKFKEMEKNHCRKELGLSLDKTICLFVGRFSEEKGLNTVFDVISNNRRTDLMFLLIGNGPLMPKAREVCKNNIAVSLCDSVNNDRLPLYYNSADVLVFGSVDMDYYGRVTMEALSCGLPVILPRTTKYFGEERKITVDFPEGKIGYLCVHDPDALGITIDKVCSGKETMRAMRGACRVYALQNFSETNAQVFIREYLN